MPAGEKIAVTVTCASGETKLLQIARAGDLESLFRAARSKFKAMKKAPNVARMHAPPVTNPWAGTSCVGGSLGR